MKRSIRAMATQWLKQPQNQQKVKRVAKQLWDRFNQPKSADNDQSSRQSPATTGSQRGKTEGQPPKDQTGGRQ